MSQSHDLPKPIVKKMRWPYPLIWIVPICALAIAGWYYHDRYKERGIEITLKFDDADGLKGDDTKVMHLGVTVGDVSGIELSPDQKQVLIHVRLQRSQGAFARQGAVFWIVRPEISTQSISGLSTVLSGPYIDSNPGAGDEQTEFTGSKAVPIATEEGLKIVLMAPRVQRLPVDAPIYFRGIEVGEVQSVALDPDGDKVDVHAFIKKRYSALVKTNSQFWIVSGVDVKGGIFTGVQMKVESLRTLLSGGVAFATPDEDPARPRRMEIRFCCTTTRTKTGWSGRRRFRSRRRN